MEGRPAEAEAQGRAAIKDNSEFGSAWLGLEDLFVTDARWEELESLAVEMEKRQALRGQGQIARIRGQIGRQEFDAAKQVLSELIREHPDSVRLRVLLSHVLLKENKDSRGAERVSREKLELEPNHHEARQTLEELRGSSARSSLAIGVTGSAWCR